MGDGDGLWSDNDQRLILSHTGTYYILGMSGKGWMDQELFRHWLKDNLLKYSVAN